MMKERASPRRAVLRAAMVAGCSRWMPVARPADEARNGESSPRPSGNADEGQESNACQRALPGKAKG